MRCRVVAFTRGRWRGIVALVVLAVLGAASEAMGEAMMGVGGSVGMHSATPAEPSMLRATLKMIGGLCFCLGALGLGMRLMRRFGEPMKTTRRRRIAVREKVSLSAKTTLFLVSVDNREYLIANGANSISVTPTHTITTPLFAESLAEVYKEAGDLHA